MAETHNVILCSQTSETTQVQKRASRRIPIIDPTTNEEILTATKVPTPHSGSAALKIEAPTSQIPNQSQQQNQVCFISFSIRIVVLLKLLKLFKRKCFFLLFVKWRENHIIEKFKNI